MSEANCLNNSIDLNQFVCEICLENYSQSGSPHAISCLPCGHIFGRSCLITWLHSLRNRISCPKCKREFSNLTLRNRDGYEDFIVNIFGLPINGKVTIQNYDIAEQLENATKELSTLREENAKLKREVKSLRRNFRYVSGQHRDNPIYTRSQHRGVISFLDEIIRSRRRNAIVQRSNDNLGNVGVSDMFAGESNSSLNGRNGVMEVVISDDEQVVNSRRPNYGSTDNYPHETIVLSDDEESGDEMVIVDDNNSRDALISSNNISIDPRSPNDIGLCIRDRVNEYIAGTQITDAVRLDEMTIFTSIVPTDINNPNIYGVSFHSPRRSAEINISSVKLNFVDAIKSRMHGNIYKILAASKNAIHIVWYDSDANLASLGNTLSSPSGGKIKALAWIDDENFAFGNSNGEVIFGSSTLMETHLQQPIKYTSPERRRSDVSSLYILKPVTREFVLGVQGKKLLLFKKSGTVKMIDEFLDNIRFLYVTRAADKLFVGLYISNNFLTIYTYNIIQVIGTRSTSLTIEKINDTPSNHFNYEMTHGPRLSTKGFYYLTNLNGGLHGFFDFNEDTKIVSARFIGSDEFAERDIPIEGTFIKIIGDLSQHDCDENRPLKVAVVSDMYIYNVELMGRLNVR
uniref:RING-type domain-containing protein n=1 Tax=Parastrongyloides trichosuri TaxID=131310 RepID=A0A0N4Z4D3_PARTI